MNLVSAVVQQCLLFQNQARIMDSCRYARAREMGAERLPPRGLAEDRKQVPHGGASLGNRHGLNRAISDPGAISCCHLAPSSRPSREPRQEDVAEDSRMYLVETAVEARLVVDIGRALSIVSKSARPECDGLVRRNHGSAVAERAEVLRRVEAHGRDLPNGTDAAAMESGPDCLGAILDDAQGKFLL